MQATTSTRGAAGRPRRRWKRVGAAALAGLLVLGVAFAASLHRGLRHAKPSTLLVDRVGRYLGELPASDGEFGYWDLPARIPDRIVRATLETEDRYFHEHAGVRVASLARAAWQNTRNLEVVSGASTIAMQVARMQSGGRRSLVRKAREAAEALLLVRDVGHDRVLRQYLTIAPYGNRVHGVVRAARLYFDKPVEDLSWLQAAWLAGLPQQPGRMNPYSEQGLHRGLARARRILRLLEARGVITEAELAQALASGLALSPRPERPPEAMHALLALGEELRGNNQTIVRLPLGGHVVATTLDLDLQARVARRVARNVDEFAGRGAGNSAALVVDRETGDVLAWVGSADFFDAEAHGAVDYSRARRSPGSTLKPFIYALGIESGRYTAASELPDTPVDFQSEGGAAYLPENINHAFLGPMLLREALGNSRNIPALRVLQDVGLEPTLQFLERGGVQHISHAPEAYGLGLAIGALPVTLEELVGLYGILANDGAVLPLRHFLDAPAAPRPRLLSASTARLLTHVLADPEARRPSFPAGSALDYPYAVAVKTGTSQGWRDAWTVAYSDRLIVGVWVGNHDWRRMNGVGGAAGAAGAAHEILDELMPIRATYKPIAGTFAPPEDWSAREICPVSGLLAGENCPHHRTEHFRRGTEPFETCHAHVPVRLDVRNHLRATAACPGEFVRAVPLLDLPERYADWARREHVELAPTEESPLCAQAEPVAARVAIAEPRRGSRYLWDPDSPERAALVRFTASVTPSTEQLVWIVDGSPVAQVGYPHELRWALGPGPHRIEAAFARLPMRSAAVDIAVDD